MVSVSEQDEEHNNGVEHYAAKRGEVHAGRWEQEMNMVYGVLSIIFGVGTFFFANPAGVPVFGLAFAAAGLIRESRGQKRKIVIAISVIGALICAAGTVVSLMIPK